MKKKFNPGFFSGVTLIIENDYLKYVSGIKLNEQGSIPIRSIKAVTVEPGPNNNTTIKFVGEGTTLGFFTTPINYAQKCQKWLIEQLNL